MGRTRYLFFSTLQILKWFVLGFGLVVLLTCQIGLSQLANHKGLDQSFYQKAQMLTTQGHQQLAQGLATDALATWQSATEIYRQLNSTEGVSGSLINQSLAIQQMGQYPRACDILVEALDFRRYVCDLSAPPELVLAGLGLDLREVRTSKAVIVGLQGLGDVLRVLGRLEASELALLKALELAKSQSLEGEQQRIFLSLGNLKRAFYSQEKERYFESDYPLLADKAIANIQKWALSALMQYRQVYENVDLFQEVAYQSRLNALSLLIDVDQWSVVAVAAGKEQVKDFQNEIRQQIEPVAAWLQENVRDLAQLPLNDAITARLNLANSLAHLAASRWWSAAFQQARLAFSAAKSLDNHRQQSYALGILAKLTSSSTQAQGLYEHARAIAEGTRAWDLAYQWQSELGQIYQLQGKTQQALQAYSGAIDNLEQVSSTLFSVFTDKQLSFRQQVAPVYQEYLRLLLAQSNPDLEQVIRVNERFQVAELENYLKCNLEGLVPISGIPSAISIPSVIFVMEVGDQIELVIRTPDGKLHQPDAAPSARLVRANMQGMLLNLLEQKVPRKAPPGLRQEFLNELLNKQKDLELLPYAQKLYDQLIKPFRQYLSESGTLLFVLDSTFQGLPMGLLHDGQQYLIERYSIAITLGGRLLPPRNLDSRDMKALLAGLSKASPSFRLPDAPPNLAPLPAVASEFVDLKGTLNSSVMLDQDFTLERFQTALEKNYPIVHLSTHGQFSSTPDRTVLLAWDQIITMQEFRQLLRQRSNRSNIELLFLSACESARGDRRSALGLAGISAQVGARSTVATLWQVRAGSAKLLASEFYKELKAGIKQGRSKAEVLRQAQLALKNNPDYSDPKDWGAWVLVGSWL
jgi:CHAT domain-containing protein